jgi:hypothetical protein
MTESLKIHQRLRTLSIVKELWLSGPKTVFLASKKTACCYLADLLFNPLSNAQVAEHIQR